MGIFDTAGYGNMDQEALIAAALAGPSEEEKKKALAMGALSAGLGILSAPRQRGMNMPAIAQGLGMGVESYTGNLKQSQAERKSSIQEALNVKKLTQEGENAKRYGDHFTGDEPDYLGLARTAAKAGDLATVKSALSMHANREQTTTTPLAPGTANVMSRDRRGNVSFIPVPDNGKIGKDPLKEQNRQALIDQGVDADIAAGVAYGSIHTVVNPVSGAIHIVDYRNLKPRVGGPVVSPIQAPAMDVAGGGTPVASVPGVTPPVASGTPPATPGAAPVQPAGGRYTPGDAPPGTIASVRGTKEKKDLDFGVDVLSKAYAKTGIEDFDRIMQELHGALADFTEKDPNTGRLRKKKGVDVPGMGMTSGLPPALLSDKGAAIAGPLQELQNIRLYDLSGKAVTANEMIRQLRALQTGMFSKDERVINSINRLQDLYEGHKTNILSGANPEVLQEYLSRKANVTNEQRKDFTGLLDEMGYEVNEDGSKTGRRYVKNKNGKGYNRVL